ncbi:MAG: hypothetical protein QM775_24370 [Pirellulales bacterium]
MVRVSAAVDVQRPFNRTMPLSAYLHTAWATHFTQVVEVFNRDLQLKLSAGGLVQMWYGCERLYSPGAKRSGGSRDDGRVCPGWQYFDP